MQQEIVDLGKQVALITGAGQRIGAQIATHAHAAGMNVALHYRHSAHGAHDLATEFNTTRENSAVTIQADLLELEAADTLVQRTLHEFGRIDLLVNNASTFYPTPLAGIDEAQWADLIGTNLKAPLFLSRAAAPHLRTSCGAIVNIVDISAHKPLPDYSIYCAAKAGLAAITRSLARELAPDVRVNAVAPGAILWPKENAPDARERASIVANIPLARLGAAEDVARSVLFLARDANYVTGQILNVDGGSSLV
ncbi:MAG: pteridine reductase [Gammaproteobacteria bacterium]|nr:pteridine reductase [Gammaproteobacteria bacterium]